MESNFFKLYHLSVLEDFLSKTECNSATLDTVIVFEIEYLAYRLSGGRPGVA
jgi:hypothetical protein